MKSAMDDADENAAMVDALPAPRRRGREAYLEARHLRRWVDVIERALMAPGRTGNGSGAVTGSR
jgi:hypothetical protein